MSDVELRTAGALERAGDDVLPRAFGALMCLLLVVGGAGCQPETAPAIDAARERRDAALDAPESIDGGRDAALADAPGTTVDDVWLERSDGCVSPFSIEGDGRPCLDSTDCPAGYACLPPSGFDPGPSCALIAIDGCGCPPGSVPSTRVTAGAAYAVCAARACPVRDTDVARLGEPCTTLRDCPDWMICEARAAGSSCELPCSAQCTCPGLRTCTERLTASGVVQRCE